MIVIDIHANNNIYLDSSACTLEEINSTLQHTLDSNTIVQLNVSPDALAETYLFTIQQVFITIYELRNQYALKHFHQSYESIKSHKHVAENPKKKRILRKKYPIRVLEPVTPYGIMMLKHAQKHKQL